MKSGSGGTHWKVERVLSVAMVGLIPTAFIYPCPVVDYGLAIALPLHGHWLVHSLAYDTAVIKASQKESGTREEGKG